MAGVHEGKLVGKKMPDGWLKLGVGGGGGGDFLVPPTSLDSGREVTRIVCKSPRKPPAGVWFLLQAADNQEKEPFLPQIPKSYLRIKDGSITVRLLLKYLTNKLELEDESEIEVMCRGQVLHPFLTLQQVRNRIWLPRDGNVMPATAAKHVMTLQYKRGA